MTWRLLEGDCVEVMRGMDPESVHAVVCDPPYGLSAQPNAVEVLRHWLAGDDYYRSGGGFMGKSWDSFVPGPMTWREAYRVLKPGGHLLAFFGSRTYDLGAMAIRLAGFEIRDTIAWIYGAGFPKSLNVARAIDGIDGSVADMTSALRSEMQRWYGWGTGLKPAFEPIVVARKPLESTVAQNVLRYGTGALNVDDCRIGIEGGGRGVGEPNYRNLIYRKGFGGLRADPDFRAGRWPANVTLDEEAAALLDKQVGDLGVSSGKYFASERYIYAFPPMIDWAGEEIGDGDSGGPSRFFYVAKASTAEREVGLDVLEGRVDTARSLGSTGSNSLGAGVGRDGARANVHPTVKPIDLMRWLVRLVTPKGEYRCPVCVLSDGDESGLRSAAEGPERIRLRRPDRDIKRCEECGSNLIVVRRPGTVLDPFAGSGSTGCAAVLEGFDFVGVEREPEYIAIAEARIRFWSEHPMGLPTEQALEAHRMRLRTRDAGQLNLFEGGGYSRL